MSPLESTLRVLNEAGISYLVVRRKKHNQVLFTVRGKNLRVTCSRTTSDHRAALNARLLVQRMIREAIG